MRFLMLILLLLSFPIRANQDLVTPTRDRYTLDKLQQALSQRHFSEAFAHLRDVPQAERNQTWRSVVEQAAVGYLRDLERKKTSSLSKFAEHWLVEYPSLQESQAFREEYHSLVLKGFGECYAKRSQRSSCSERLATFLSQNSSDRDLSRELANLAYEKDRAAFVKRICPLLKSQGEEDRRCSPDNSETARPHM